MSDVYRRIVTTFQASPGNVRAVMADVRGGMGMLRRETREFANEQGYLNRQLRAFGTTSRYAIAGGTIFGAVGGVSQLSQVQKELGLISAIGDVTNQAGRQQLLVGDSLNQLASDIRDSSVRALTPLNEMNMGVLNFLSTVQNVPRSDLVPMVEDIAKAAQIAQTGAEDATKAFTTMNIAFGRGNTRETVRGAANMFSALISLAPGGRMAGHEIIGQMGPLSSVFALGHGTPEQMMSLTLGALRFGGTPSTSLRGLQFLAQSIVQPSTPAAAKALAGIGITPKTVEQQGIYSNLIRFLKHVQSLGVKGNVKNLAKLPDETLTEIESIYGPGALETIPGGISGAGAKFTKTAIGRIHGIRAAVVLASQLDRRGGVSSLAENLKTMQNAETGNVDDTLKLSAQWNRLSKEAKLTEAARAVEAMRMDILTVFEPILNLAGKQVVGLRGVVSRHPEAFTYGAAGFLGAWATASRVRRLPLGRSFVGAQAIQDTLSGGNIPGQSPQNPLYVIVVGQIFGGGRGPVPAPVLGPHGPAPRPTGSRLGRLARGARGFGIFGAAAGLIGAPAVMDYIDRQKAIKEEIDSTRLLDFLTHDQGGTFIGAPMMGIGVRVGEKRPSLTSREARVLNALKKGNITKETAERRLRQIGSEQHLKSAGVNRVQGQVKVDVVIKDKKGNEKGTASVTADLFPGFRAKAPQTRGQDKTTRGANR
jgi:hypothetical protein